MKDQKSMFRAYDLRGIVGEQLDNQTYFNLGRAYACFLLSRKIPDAVVGFDNRLESKEFSENFCNGLNEMGIDVKNIGLALSPNVYFAQYHFQSKGAAMITASHNPKEFNGLKLAVGFSDTMTEDEMVFLKDSYFNIDSEVKNYTIENKGKTEHIDVWEDYTNYLLRLFPNKVTQKIVIDTSNGTAGYFIPDLLRKFGCTVIEQNTELDGTFPHGTPDPTEVGLQSRLAEGVKRHGADLGVSLDGDGDRVGIVDSEGNLIWNDILVAIFSMDILSTHKNASIVYNNLCSKVVEETIIKHGGKPTMWLTGHSFIKAKLKEIRGAFGGELSGHFFFMDNFFGHDDAAYAILRLLNFLTNQKQSLVELYNSLNKYISSPEIKIGATDETKFDTVNQHLAQKLTDFYPNAETNTIEGIRLSWETGMIMVRASQNGPYITIKFESSDKEEFEVLKTNIKDILTSTPGIDPTYGNSLEFIGIENA